MKLEGSFVQAKPIMKLGILLTSYSLLDNILILKHKCDWTILNTLVVDHQVTVVGPELVGDGGNGDCDDD